MSALLDALLGIAKRRGPASTSGRYYGLCRALYSTTRVDSKSLEAAFTRWPEFSGEVEYPVPMAGRRPGYAYNTTKDMWVGEYGAARLRLVDFLIAECEAGRLA